MRFKDFNFLLCLCFALLVSFTSTDVCAQNSKKVKDLKAQKTRLQKNLKKSQQDLAKTGKEVKSGQTYLHYIDQQLDDRLAHIKSMESEMDSVEKEMDILKAEIADLDAQLTEKKQTLQKKSLLTVFTHVQKTKLILWYLTVISALTELLI